MKLLYKYLDNMFRKTNMISLFTKKSELQEFYLNQSGIWILDNYRRSTTNTIRTCIQNNVKVYEQKSEDLDFGVVKLFDNCANMHSFEGTINRYLKFSQYNWYFIPCSLN